jgi:hypothetical protein
MEGDDLTNNLEVKARAPRLPVILTLGVVRQVKQHPDQPRRLILNTWLQWTPTSPFRAPLPLPVPPVTSLVLLGDSASSPMPVVSFRIHRPCTRPDQDNLPVYGFTLTATLEVISQ